jgi:hypothetical protein
MAKSVRQIRGSQCDLDWSTHALNEEVNLSGMLLCQSYQQDKLAPAMRNVKYVNFLQDYAQQTIKNGGSNATFV